MDWRWQNGSWVGRGALPGDFYDLAVTGGDGWDDAPPPEAVARLEAAHARVETLFAAAVRAVCEARRAALGWRDGPPLADWSLVEMRLAADDRLWVSVHEYETDEYSLWMAAFDDAWQTGEVRRRPWVPVEGDPVAAGTIVGV